MWAEQTDVVNLDRMGKDDSPLFLALLPFLPFFVNAYQQPQLTSPLTVWSRASAVAEVLWSGPRESNGQLRSQITASPRLSEMRERLVSLGVGAEPIQMPYCLMESDGGQKPQCQLGWK